MVLGIERRQAPASMPDEDGKCRWTVAPYSLEWARPMVWAKYH